MKVLSTFNFDILFFHRYVDNLVMVIPSSKTDEVFTKFNSFHPRIQLTMKIGG